jgi:hypothetical protein
LRFIKNALRLGAAMREPLRGRVQFGMAPFCPLPLGTKIDDFGHGAQLCSANVSANSMTAMQLALRKTT